MTWVARLALIVISLALIRSLWAGLGPPWRWPILLARAVRRAFGRAGRAFGRAGRAFGRAGRAFGRAGRAFGGAGRAVGRVRKRRSPAPGNPDPFTALHGQYRLGLIATELQVLEANDADLTYYARAHRIHTRRSAYDQLLAEACKLAGVPAQHPGPEGGICRNADERFSVEMELAARGWHW